MEIINFQNEINKLLNENIGKRSNTGNIGNLENIGNQVNNFNNSINELKEIMDFIYMIYSIMALYLLIILITIYIIPSIIVIFQNKKNKIEIILLNIFLGWTFTGWVIALIMSLKNEYIINLKIDLKDLKNEIKNDKIEISVEELRKKYGPK